ncbi:unnamed protein product [Trifolium pratense]|uniref:Uncharacterized protein n=1 Tax=Trifolium pratense TaxID=57577 RepID=A0ACB0KBY6_TRIPR|nr:unnamed protein product [Trifolium pratense]
MGATSSKTEDDKALQLCRERKKFVRQALDGRCSLAAAHISYVHSLKIVGTALRKFTEPEPHSDSSLYNNATPQALALTDKAMLHSSPSMSQRTDAAETQNFYPTPSPPSSSKFHANHMRLSGFSSKKVEEKPPVPVIATVTSSDVAQNGSRMSETEEFGESSVPDGTPQWDYFGIFNPVDHQFSFQEAKGTPEEGIPELEDDEEKVSSCDSRESDDEFDEEPTAETLVQRFENLNRANSHVLTNVLPMKGDSASEVELVNGEKGNSPYLSPSKKVPTVALVPPEANKPVEKENHSENKVTPKNFFASMKDIEQLFDRASDSGKEVPRMLEANKFHFRPLFQGKENGSLASLFFKACFSCGEDPSQVLEEPAQNSAKYLTWHTTPSSQSSSSKNPLDANSRENFEDHTNNLFDNSCMNSGSHVSTLDRLHAWERKLYDEVKASEIVRKEYDMKCKILRNLESKAEKTSTIDKTRAAVKDLHSRIRVAIHRIDSISKRIEELRDRELQPQLEELIEGLNRMWEVMHECHKLQFQIMSASYNNSHARITMHSELRRQITSYLENELHFLSSSFTKWIEAQKSYLVAINGWIHKCVPLQQKSFKRKRRPQSELLIQYGPPIYATCDVWLKKIGTLPVKDVVDSIKSLASDTARFLPYKDKNQGNGTDSNIGGEPDGLLRDDVSEDWISGFDRFRASLIRFLGQLNSLSGSSVKMYNELQQAIQEAKITYHRYNSSSQNGHSNSQSQHGYYHNSESQDEESKSQSQVV